MGEFYRILLARDGEEARELARYPVPIATAHPKGYVKSELFKEVSSRLTEALDMNASLRSDIAESQARVRFLQARLNKIEDILNPNIV